MKPNTIIKLPDGRVGTICYSHLDGIGGVWGEHEFINTENGGFSDCYPEPEFMLQDKERGTMNGGECVGEESEIEFEVLREGYFTLKEKEASDAS